jgi:hypothetical protein
LETGSYELVAWADLDPPSSQSQLPN